MDRNAARMLLDFLKKQKEATARPLPHRHHLLLEHVSTGPGGAPGNQVVLHTFWGGRINHPLSLALDAAWESRFGQRLEIYADNDCIVMLLPHEVEAETPAEPGPGRRCGPAASYSIGRARVFSGPVSGNAPAVPCCCPEAGSMNACPSWMSRIRSQKLLNSVRSYDDFPILLEAWRTCLRDEFDLDGLKLVLTELESGRMHWSEAHTSYPSPMARGVTWRQVNQYMYATDAPITDRPSSLRSDLLRDLVFSPALRPTVALETVERFVLKRQRLHPGYSPSDARELIEWIKERRLVPLVEWRVLLEAMHRDHDLDEADILGGVDSKLVSIQPIEAASPLIAALESADRIVRALYDPQKVTVSTISGSFVDLPAIGPVPDDEAFDPDEMLNLVLSEWLRYYGPVSPGFMETTLGIDPDWMWPGLEDLIESESLITGPLVTDGPKGRSLRKRELRNPAAAGPCRGGSRVRASGRGASAFVSDRPSGLDPAGRGCGGVLPPPGAASLPAPSGRSLGDRDSAGPDDELQPLLPGYDHAGQRFEVDRERAAEGCFLFCRGPGFDGS